MTSQKETISPATMFIRYTTLTLMTVGLIIMIGTSFWLIYLYVGYMNVFPGYEGYGMSNFGWREDVRTIRETGGVVLYSVEPNSAADKAGLQAKDSIVAINGVQIHEEPQAFVSPYLWAQSGEQVRIDFFRDGIQRHTTLVLEDYRRVRAMQGYLGVTSTWVSRDTSKDQVHQSPAGLHIRGVDAGTPADSAGIIANDILVLFDGEPLNSDTQFTRLITTRRPGSKVGIDLWRNDTTVHTVARLGEKYHYSTGTYGVQIRGSAGWIIWLEYLPSLSMQFALFIVGAFIGWLKPRNTIAFRCSLFFMGASAATFDEAVPFIAACPAWLATFLFMFMELMTGLAILWVIRMFSIFPNPSRLGKIFLRWQWLAFVICVLYSVSTCADWVSLFIGLKLPWLFHNPISQMFVDADTWMVTLIFGIMLALLIAQRVETRRNPKNRMKVIELGFLLAMVGFLLSPWSPFPIASVLPENMVPYFRLVSWIIAYLFFSGLPLLFAYSVVANRVFDIRFIIRKGLRYLLLSKGALLVEGIIVFLIVIQILNYAGTEFLNSPTAVGGVAVASTLAVIAAVGRVNRKLMPVIDRRFFREVLDVRKLLLDLNQQLSAIREREQILQQTANTVLRALHPARVMMLLKHGKSDEFRCELTLENERAKQTSVSNMAVTDQSVTVTEAQVQCHGVDRDTPVQGLMLKTKDTIIKQMEEKGGWIIVNRETLDLEKDEDKRLSAVNCELFIGLRGSSGLIGVMGLGDKLSEEPYSKEDREILLTVAHEMGMALENAELLEVAKREAEFSKELDIARQVQQNLFPKQLPTPSGWEFAGTCKPAKAVGGDYYDIFEAVPGKVVVALGDVSGKGLGASFVMSGVHSTIRTQAKKSFDNPVGIIDELNEYLLGSTSKNIFVTLFLGIVDLVTGKLSYVNCGHPPAFVVRKENGEIEKLTRTGLALGMMNTVQFTQGASTLKVGDSLIVYSDGITEAMNEKEEMYEEERLTQLLTTTLGLDTSHMMEAILKSVSEFIGQAEQSDDVSIIVARRKLETG